MYTKLILEVDAVDNGVNPADRMRYHIRTGLSLRAGRMNAEWNAPKTVNQHAQFKKAMKICEEEFLWNLKGLVMVKMPALNLVKEAFAERKSFHPSGELLFLEKQCPWKAHLFSIEKDEGCEG